ncbi:MAG TPA: sulfurtransferase [Candidatus Corynebacterium avicola]|uniref:Sulfurtransferase n=1 Tax=Candidatus Corynebacterium avicola TaxID=2838527 RepID=A0A9D1RQ09_9CORY|nr:sulfurtransferase [Candidatus Corynebacterium avicola]
MTLSQTPFISPDDLYAASTRGDRMVILDSDWEPGGDTAWNLYVTRHIPGSFFCDPTTMLAGSPSSGQGRAPLPNPRVLQHFIDDWGIQPGLPVRIYDRGGLLHAARAWWVLRWAGVTDVQILDGGTKAWQAAGGDVAAGIGCMRGRGTFEAFAGGAPTMPVASFDEVAALSETASDTQLLIDARTSDRFHGRSEPMDRRAGHIPGAVNAPVIDLLDDAGRVPSPEVVREGLAAHGLTADTAAEAVIYSGSGVDSALFIALMEHAGLPAARHFVGGWSQWALDRSRPVSL